MQTQLVPGMQHEEQYLPDPVESTRSGGLTWSHDEAPTGGFEGNFLCAHATGLDNDIARQQELYSQPTGLVDINQSVGTWGEGSSLSGCFGQAPSNARHEIGAFAGETLQTMPTCVEMFANPYGDYAQFPRAGPSGCGEY